MEAVFIKLLNMSIVASFLIIAIIVLRLLLQNSPKWIRCVMWALVAVRLAVPFSFESMFSLVPNAQKIASVHNASTSYISTGSIAQSAETGTGILSVVTCVWAVGVALLLLYMIVSYVRLQIKVKESIKLKDNVWLCDGINSPFVMGIFKPKIYLVSSIKDKEKDYVLAHEKTHLARFDNIWKPIGFLLLSVYWFNPLQWDVQ